MRIIILTAGTGSFHCGTCMRDNALAVALQKLGHDAILLPMYLPTILDEAPATADAPLFYGGINVYLQQISPLFRKTPRALDRLLDSPGMLRAAAKRAGMTSAKDLGELTISMLKGEEGRQAKELDRLIAWLEAEGRPDVVCLSNALLLGMARRIKQRTGAAVVCTLQGEDSFLDGLPEPHRTDAWQLIGKSSEHVDALIAVSKYHRDLMMERANFPADKMHVVHNGILLDGYVPTESLADRPTIGYMARMCKMKGLDRLVDAYIDLRKRNRVQNLKLRIAGSENTADERFVHQLEERIEENGFADDVEFHPNVSREQKIDFLRGLSVLSVPATYGESFGLYLLEAWACGVPVVQPRSGAFPELIADTGGGTLYDQDKPEALADALQELLLDPERARALGESGRKAVVDRFGVEHMAAGVLRVFELAANTNCAPLAVG